MKRRMIDGELTQVVGGISGWIAGPIGYFLKQGFEHSDQIIRGFKRGWRKY